MPIIFVRYAVTFYQLLQASDENIYKKLQLKSSFFDIPSLEDHFSIFLYFLRRMGC